MTLETERRHALALLRRHPGWGAPRVAKVMAEQGMPVHQSTIARWRVDARLAPAKWHVTRADRHGRQLGVELECGHLGVPPDPGAERVALCRYCGWQPLRDPSRQLGRRYSEPPLELEPRPEQPPDAAPSQPESSLHFVDRSVIDVARDLIDRARYGGDDRAAARAELRRAGMTEREVDSIVGGRRTKPRR